MDTIRETAELIFYTSLGRTRVIRVPNPVAGITQPLLNTVVTRITAAQPFDETIGQLEALRRADRVTVSRMPLLPEPVGP